ncbi:DNRLRE domain-containing protein [bacterium]|nr:DNRLRE domain-containing protein [bacterium]NIO72867.1 DNRLRE domain-containing protein [bacterium]
MVNFMGKRMKILRLLVFCVLAIFCIVTHSYAKEHIIQPGPEKSRDSHISKGVGDLMRNFGSKESMGVGLNDSKRLVLRFDLSSIPPDAIISSAELQLCLAEEYDFAPQRVIYVHRITGFWKDKEVTWQRRVDNRDWKNLGGDFDWEIESAKSLTGINYGWVSWDVTRTIKNWLKGEYVNFGFLLKENCVDTDTIWFLSSEAEWEAYRPKLVISYETEAICPEPEPVSPAIKVYPNPFKPSEGHTEITFTNLPSGASVKIFHIEGRIIETLEEAAGEAKWNVKDSGGDKISSGLYLYRVESSKGNKTGKVVIIR